MGEDQQPKPCQSCDGTGVTEHTQHTVETDEKGNQKPVKHSYTGPCSSCSGRGEV